MADDRSFIRDHYVGEYFNNASEPHRRRPAIVNFPCTVWHVGVYHKDKPAERKAFLRKIKAEIPRMLSGWRIVRSFSNELPGEIGARFQPLDSTFLERFFDQKWFTGEGSPDIRARTPGRLRPRRGKNTPDDTVFCFECVPADHEKWTLRFELHTEYFTVSIFTCFDIIAGADGELTVKTYQWDHSRSGAYRERSYTTGSRVPPDQSNALRLILDHGFVAPPDLPESTPTGPICKLLRKIVELADHGVFCDFRGVVTDWKLFDNYLRERGPDGQIVVASPDLLPERFGAFIEPRDHAPTQRFLHRIWPALATTIFARASQNLVGCYMQGGHAIYLSALGAQGLPPTREQQLSPVTFLLIYDPPKTRREGNTHRWRLSRLTNRLIEVGVNRVVSLHRLKALRKAMTDVADLENTFDRRLGTRLNPHKFEQLLDGIHDSVGGSLSYRVGRADKYFRMMTTLVEDLGVRTIPGWLSYDEFLNRRLSNTHEEISKLPLRMEALRQKIRLRSQNLNTKATERIQWLGTVVAIVGLFYVVTEAFPHWMLSASVGMNGLIDWTNALTAPARNLHPNLAILHLPRVEADAGSPAIDHIMRGVLALVVFVPVLFMMFCVWLWRRGWEIYAAMR